MVTYKILTEYFRKFQRQVALWEWVNMPYRDYSIELMTLIRTIHDSSVDVTWQIDSIDFLLQTSGIKFPWLILLFSLHACIINILQVDPPCDCSVPSNCVDKPLCNSAIDASNLLNINSYTNHDAYCLAYIFTYRDFEGGTLGLAWVAEPGSKWTMIRTVAF